MMAKKGKGSHTKRNLSPQEIAGEIRSMSKEDSQRILRNAAPWLVKPPEIRSNVEEVVRSRYGRAYADKLDKVLGASLQVADLDMQLTAMNPNLLKYQRDGTITREREQAIESLTQAWIDFLKIV